MTGIPYPKSTENRGKVSPPRGQARLRNAARILNDQRTFLLFVEAHDEAQVLQHETLFHKALIPSKR
jgi:hypothetical protein